MDIGAGERGRRVFKKYIQHFQRLEGHAHITVDRFAPYGIVAQTLADLQRRGLQKIGFVNNGTL